MPLYEYRCANEHCGHRFERIKPFNRSSEDDTCPKDAGVGKRIMSVTAPAIVPGGTHAQRSNNSTTLADFPDRNEWIDA